MWVQLLTIKQITINGSNRQFYPGDCVEAGKQTALLWISQGEARALDSRQLEVLDAQCGVLIRGGNTEHAEQITRKYGILGTALGDARCVFARTLIWTPGLRLRYELLPVGFSLLERWDVLVPLASYEEMALDIGDDNDRANTKSVIRDLRVPYYDPRLLFVKNSRAGRDLLACWTIESKLGSDERLAFLRALYHVKPLVLALPKSWLKKESGR